MKSSILSLVLTGVIFILGFLIFTSIKEPLAFREELQDRNKVVIAKLIDIRTAEIFFKQLNNRYTGSFDTLIEFIRKGKIPVVKLVANPKDTTLAKLSNYTIWYISISDTLFGKNKKMKPEDIATVPFSAGAKFFLAAGRIDKEGVSSAVFEASTPYATYLSGLDKELLTDMVKEIKSRNEFPGLQVGSLNKVSTAGSWEY